MNLQCDTSCCKTSLRKQSAFAEHRTKHRFELAQEPEHHSIRFAPDKHGYKILIQAASKYISTDTRNKVLTDPLHSFQKVKSAGYQYRGLTPELLPDGGENIPLKKGILHGFFTKQPGPRTSKLRR